MLNEELRMTNDEFIELKDISTAERAFWSLGLEERADFVLQEDAPVMIYDLEERTARFGEAIIVFAKRIPWGP